MLDQVLNDIAVGRNATGSFTDYFVPTISRAIDAGASQEEVNIRVDRLLELTERGFRYSVWFNKLLDEGGREAVRAYIPQ